MDCLDDHFGRDPKEGLHRTNPLRSHAQIEAMRTDKGVRTIFASEPPEADLTIVRKYANISEEEWMPQTRVVLYQEDDGSVPLLKWLDRLHDKAQSERSWCGSSG